MEHAGQGRQGQEGQHGRVVGKGPSAGSPTDALSHAVDATADLLLLTWLAAIDVLRLFWSELKLT